MNAATERQIVVLGASASIPFLDTKVTIPEAIVPKGSGTIAGQNLTGWTWRVRAQDQKGQWGGWSESRTFDVRAPKPPEAPR